MRPRLLILKQRIVPTGKPYEGTDREHPYYHDEFPEDHPVNQAFLWYVEESGEGVVVRDIRKALDLVKVYDLYTGQKFEIVEVVYPHETPVVGSLLLGYDISYGYWTSLLSRGFRLEQLSEKELQNDPQMRVVDPLVVLIGKYFQPKLNERGLFSDSYTAEFCLNCMMALQKTCPNLWEEDDMVFEVIGLYKVELDIGTRSCGV